MKFSSFKSHMTTTSFIFILALFSTFDLWSMTGKHCGENKYSSELISIEEDDECLIYTVEVSFNGKCSYELSHYNIDPGCGTITDAENSEGWPMELNGYDRKTGLSGLKVDEISRFGKGDLKSFTVSFKFCPDEQCQTDCISPKVAYKAGFCVYYDSLEVSCKNPLVVEASATEPTCPDGTDGSITLSIEGGTEPYAVEWNTGSTEASIDQLSPGNYVYIITDADGESYTDSVQLSGPAAISVIEQISDPSCVSSSDGSIVLNVSGGTAPYSFSWNTGDSTVEISGLSSGNYTVNVTDANGCTTSESYVLQNSNPILISETIQQPGCGDSSPGSIELAVSGGTAPYEYSWSDNITEQNRYNLSEGSFSVTVTDAAGCSLTKNYTLETQSDINLSTNVTHTTCNNDPVGAVDLFVSGGTAPYSYEWSNGETTEDLSGLTAGKYAVTVTDALGCQAQYEVNINQNSIILYARVTKPSCPGAGDASVDLNVFFATGEYTVEWSNGATTEDLSGISAGDYTVTVTDELGCTASRYVQVSDPSPIQVAYDVLPVGCDENLTYEVQLNPTGGSGAYTYEWETGSTEANETFNTSGTYVVTVTDENECSVTESILVEGEANSPTCLINDNGTTTPVCGTDGNQLSTSIAGAVSYQWSVQSNDNSWQITSANNTNQITYLSGSEGSQATFYLEVVLENGCTATCLYTVSACTPETDPDNPDDGGTDPDNPDDGTDPDNPDNPDGGDDGSDNPDDGGSDNPDNPDDGSGDNPDDGSDNPDDGSGDGDGSGGDNGDSDGGDNPDDGGSDDGSGDGNDSDNPDDGNDGSDGDNPDQPGDNGDKSCDECFYSGDIEIVKNGYYYDYTVTVNHNRDCNYDLSHLVITLPECAYVKDYSNSMGWKMTRVYNDNKTGLSGIKVDDIPSFGKDDTFDSFEIYFTLKSFDEDCKETLACFEPTIGYKAGQCVQYEEANSNCAEEEDSHVFCKTYPNPTTDWVKVNFNNKNPDADYTIDVHNSQGYRLNRFKINSGRDKDFDIDLSKYEGTLFFLNVKGTDGSHKTFRILKQ